MLAILLLYVASFMIWRRRWAYWGTTVKVLRAVTRDCQINKTLTVSGVLLDDVDCYDLNIFLRPVTTVGSYRADLIDNIEALTYHAEDGIVLI